MCGSYQKVSDAESVEQAGRSPGPGRKTGSGTWGQGESRPTSQSPGWLSAMAAPSFPAVGEGLNVFRGLFPRRAELGLTLADRLACG